MLLTSEATRPYSKVKLRLPIPEATINAATYNPIEATRLRLAQVQNAILMAEQEQARNRRGKRGAEIDRKKRALNEELDWLSRTFTSLTATPKEEKKTNPIVHCGPKQKTPVDYLSTPLFRSLSMAGLAVTLLTPGLALAESGPTPEPTRPVTVSRRYTINLSRTEGNKVTLWTRSNGSNATLLSLPPLNLGHVQAAIADEYGAMVNPAGCADQIAETNISNVETMDAARARLKKQTGIYSSDRLVTIPEARMVVDLINACALKAKQMIQTVLPTISVAPSKVAPTVIATKIPPSSTPIKSPTATPTPKAEASSTTDTTEEYIKYGFGGALVIALIGLGSLAALVIHNNKNKEKKDRPSPAILRPLPSETEVIDPRVLPLSGQGQPFNVHVDDGKPELPATFEPRVMVIDADDPNLLQRVLNTLAKAIKREDRSIVRAKAAALMHHEKDHASNTSDGVAIIGIIRDRETNQIIGAAVKDANPSPTPEAQKRMFLGPSKPSEHDIKNAMRAEEEIKKRKK